VARNRSACSVEGKESLQRRISIVSWSAFSRPSDWPHANLEIMVVRRMRFCP
jgi:hypothetical protein